jgi:hypothetical protein
VDSLSKLIELFYKPLTGRVASDGTPNLSRNSSTTATSNTGGSLLSKSDADLLFGQVFWGREREANDIL